VLGVLFWLVRRRRTAHSKPDSWISTREAVAYHGVRSPSGGEMCLG
jgi:hypothetical protein